MKFLFDLDGTVTSEETLPIIANHFECKEEIAELTKSIIQGNVPFVESFLYERTSPRNKGKYNSYMDKDEIQKMFSEMGLGSSDLRDKLVKDLSIDVVSTFSNESIEVATSNNTLKAELYA